MSEIFGNNLTWFWGVVEDIADPLKVGRVRVRAYYWHIEDKAKMPTEELPWAQVVMPVSSASMSGLGDAPVGLKRGSTVLGFFLDGQNAQRPMILGSLPGIPVENANPQKGFFDPTGTFPKYIEEPDSNRLARNENETLSTTKNSSRTTGVATANDGDSWDEPQSAYNAVYPNNKVFESESGHVIEIDDTSGSERIHEYHKSGTFYEIGATGNKVTRVIGDNYEIIAGNDYVNIKGSCNVTIEGDARTKINGDWNIECGGNFKVVAERIDLN